MSFISRSLLVLCLLYGLLFAVGSAALATVHAPLWYGVVFAIGLVSVQFVVAPYVIERLLTIYWDDERTEMPEAAHEFVASLAATRGIPAPRIGVIQSGTPNAFCFGHVPGNARLVVTSGLIEILTPEEFEAVLAHEVGHIEHWDFAVMTVASLVPLVLYQLFVGLRGNNNARVVAAGAYAGYLVSQFAVLLLNRTRESFADHYSAEVTGAPGLLASALVKIALGLVQSEGEYGRVMKEGTKDQKKDAVRAQKMAGALGVMGISNVRSGAALVLGGTDAASAARVLRWDLVNPWARFYELQSTHPLTAFRVKALNLDALARHQAPAYPLPERPGLDWGTFPLEFALWALPFIGAGLLAVVFTSRTSLAERGIVITPHHVAMMLMLVGASWAVKILYRYRGSMAPAAIGTLLEDEHVSEMRPKAVRLRGEILGRGVPGAFWSPDLVLKDSTGLLFVLYRQSIPFARFLFAIRSAEDYVGQEVVIDGWYRRGVQPYVEMSKLVCDRRTHRAVSRWVQLTLAAAVFALGLSLLVR